jgi:hypothetical protein
MSAMPERMEMIARVLQHSPAFCPSANVAKLNPQLQLTTHWTPLSKLVLDSSMKPTLVATLKLLAAWLYSGISVIYMVCWWSHS